MNQDIDFIPLEEDIELQPVSNIPKPNPKRRYMFLDGTKKLDYYLGEKEYHFPFKKISPEELKKIRYNPSIREKFQKEKKAILLLKYYGTYYMAIIPAKLSLTSQTIGTHLCGGCNRCYASSDFNGGCAKVRDLWVSSYLKDGDSLEVAVKKSCRLEKYPFITMGLETIFGISESFAVLDCNRYIVDQPPKEKTWGMDLLKLKYELHLHVKPGLSWEEFFLSHKHKLKTETYLPPIKCSSEQVSDDNLTIDLW